MAGIGEGIGSLLGAGAGLLFGGEGGMGTRKDIVNLWKDLEAVDFDMSQLPAPQLEMVAQLFPELYNAQIQGEAQQITESPEMREKQALALSQMEDVAREGMTDVDRLEATRAKEAIAQANRRSQASILQNLGARGQLGGGTELAARLAGSEQAGQAGADMGADLVRQSALRRLAGVEGAAGMAGNIRGQDINVASRNAELADRFNALASQLLTNAAQNNAQMRMGAQQYNVGTKQNIANQNVLNQANTAARNQEYLNSLRQTGYENQVQKIKGQSGAMGGLAGAQDIDDYMKKQAYAQMGQGAGGLFDAATGLGF
jgi:hypothetical protein